MKCIKLMLAAGALLALTACLGHSSEGNTLTGQVKKAKNITPLLCSNYHAVDVSLGVLRNGVGSMSTEDIWLYVPNDADFAVLQQAADTGAIVKVTYNVERARWCVPNDEATHVELSKPM